MKKLAFNFFAVLEVSQITYAEDVAHGTALRFDLECGNNHYARHFDQIRKQMDDKRGTKEELLDRLTIRTKAAIIESILGLGYIFKQQ
eukprot:14986246-Heterocapsa_arctica.AAC.1